jgi:acetyl-CoA carboxylase biotin carboxyl carrier protein
MLTFEQIKELIDIVCQKGLQGLEVERSDFRLRIDGQPSSGSPPAAGGSLDESSERDGEQASVSSSLAAGGSLADRERKQIAVDGGHTITSPIVGTFYAAPSPDAEPYVQVGDEVKTGQVLCIVEAMKLMNEIESDIDGVVVEVFGRNSQPVEFGEPLFAIQLT